MKTSTMTAAGGVTITRTAEQFDPAELTRIAALVDRRRGGVLSSGMEYPGRYTRWHMAYVNPPVEIACRGRQVTARALNDRGRVLMPVIRAAMLRAGVARPEPGPAGPGSGHGAHEGLSTVTVFVPEGEETFTEEQRSRRPTVFSVLREIAAAFGCPDPHLGLYGAFGYDLAFQFEPVRTSIDRSDDQRDLVLHLPDQIWVVDLRREEALRYSYDFTVAGPAGDPGSAGDPAGAASTAGLPRETAATPEPGPGSAELPPQPVPGRYAAVVEQAKERFRCGDLFEVVPGHTFHERCASPSRFYERLRERNPAPFEFLLNLGPADAGGSEYLVGASPEMYVRVNGDRVETCPISGTIARGRDAIGDAEQIRQLLNSEKDEFELNMCTDVDRNDKARICVPGTIKVLARRQIETYSKLFHTVDHVEGMLRPGFDALDAFLTHAWAVTVTGAPKLWAMQFVEDNERSPRRWYAGAIGAVNFDGSINTGLTIRTIRMKDGLAEVRVGATCLFDSDPAAEDRECQVKAAALFQALRGDPPKPLSSTAPDATGSGKNVLLIDHDDSFVHMLADYFRQVGANVTVVRYVHALKMLAERSWDLIVLSPGPGRPEDFKISTTIDAALARKLPIFGVCLGVQAMGEYFGGQLGQLAQPAHGRPSRVQVRGGRLMQGLPNEIVIGRYHSLFVERDSMPEVLTVTAATEDGVAMAIEHKTLPVGGVQFHPESLMSLGDAVGLRIVENAFRLNQPG